MNSDELLNAGLLQRLPSGAGPAPPGCEHDCEPILDFDSQREEGLVGVGCPYDPACWPGLRYHAVELLEGFVCNLPTLFAALHPVNDLAPLELPRESELAPVGMLNRHGLRLPVYWWPELTTSPSNWPTELIPAPRDGWIIFLGPSGQVVPAVAQDVRAVALPLPPKTSGDLELWRALELIDPSYRENRSKSPVAIYDDVRIEFDTKPGAQHSVRINGVDCEGFAQSNQRFLRLLILAAARRADRDVDGGGWIHKSKLQIDAKNHELEELREQLRRVPCPALTEADRFNLIKTAPERDGRVRLAIRPSAIHFDERLGSLELHGGKPKVSRQRPTAPGRAKHAQDLRAGLKLARELLATAKQLGIHC